jgi:hypothetical protein
MREGWRPTTFRTWVMSILLMLRGRSFKWERLAAAQHGTMRRLLELRLLPLLALVRQAVCASKRTFGCLHAALSITIAPSSCQWSLDAKASQR